MELSLKERYLEELKAFLRIPSISTDPAHKQDVRRAADFVAGQLQQAGMRNVGLIEKDGHNPLVYGEWLDAPGKPTLLMYGHYDVQPPDPLEEWKSPPFEPEVRGDNIYARGAADDKGLTLILIKAVEQLMRRGGLPVNVRFLVEGEEEVGGEHIEEFVQTNDSRLKADAALVCDTEMFAPELPTICTGLRGIVYGELHAQGAEADLHSGMYGGAAPNPIQGIAEILCALKDRDGHIRIPGFYDRVAQPSATEVEAWQRLPFDAEHFRTAEMRTAAITGEPEQDILKRIWARPTLEVHGIRGGFTGEGAKTVIPARAVAKISMRLVPDQRPEEASQQFGAAVATVCPKGIKAEWKAIHSAPPSLTDADNRFIQACAEAMTEIFGNQTVYVRSGGSIPIVGLFREHLGIPSVLAGFGLPDDNLHSPNEKLYLPNFYRGIEATIRYLEKLS